MTTLLPPSDDARVAELLRVYTGLPLDDGDVVLVLDDEVCLELAGFADQWDDTLRATTGQVVRETASRVLIAIARAHARLLDTDHQLWRDLRDELHGADVELLPLRALPAA